MKSLDARLAEEVSPSRYPVDGTGVGIVHLGPGAFHRAHQAVFTEDALAFGGDWRICGVSMRSNQVRDALAPQDFRYTLAVRDQRSSTRVIHALAEILVARDELEVVFDRMTALATHLFTLTITEKGYCLNSDGELDWDRPEIRSDLANPRRPMSAVGLLAEALRRRRAAATEGLTIIACDNLAENGGLLGRAVRSYAERIEPGLGAWIEDRIAFPSTMVDAITPATDDALREHVADEAGYLDAMPVSREAFSQWVIEDSFSGPRPYWDRAGVTFTNDVAAFEQAKIRLLNGAHSALAYTGMLAGHETVLEAISDSALHEFVRAMMLSEIVPTLRTSPDLELTAYVDQIIERFRNPAIAYRLSQIAWDGSQKVRIRLLDTIADNLAAGRDGPRLAYAVAAWFHYVRRCERGEFEMTDPARDQLLAAAARCNTKPAHDVQIFVHLPDVFSPALQANEEFHAQLIEQYRLIETGQPCDAR